MVLPGWRSGRLSSGRPPHGPQVGPVRSDLQGPGDRAAEPGGGVPRSREGGDGEHQAAAVSGDVEGFLALFRVRGQGAIGEPEVLGRFGEVDDPADAGRVADGEGDDQGECQARG